MPTSIDQYTYSSYSNPIGTSKLWPTEWNPTTAFKSVAKMKNSVSTVIPWKIASTPFIHPRIIPNFPYDVDHSCNSGEIGVEGELQKGFHHWHCPAHIASNVTTRIIFFI